MEGFDALNEIFDGTLKVDPFDGKDEIHSSMSLQKFADIIASHFPPTVWDLFYYTSDKGENLIRIFGDAVQKILAAYSKEDLPKPSFQPLEFYKLTYELLDYKDLTLVKIEDGTVTYKSEEDSKDLFPGVVEVSSEHGECVFSFDDISKLCKWWDTPYPEPKPQGILAVYKLKQHIKDRKKIFNIKIEEDTLTFDMAKDSSPEFTKLLLHDAISETRTIHIEEAQRAYGKKWNNYHSVS